jgi:hypothetical protein
MTTLYPNLLARGNWILIYTCMLTPLTNILYGLAHGRLPMGVYPGSILGKQHGHLLIGSGS